MDMPPHPFEADARLAADLDPVSRAKALGAALEAIPEFHRWLRQARQEAVLEMRAGGMSHGDVSKALGVSRSRAQQIAEGRVTGKRAGVVNEEGPGD